MGRREGPSSITVGTVGGHIFAKYVLAQAVGISNATMRFMAGPPMTERERFNRNVAEARTRSDWLRPH